MSEPTEGVKRPAFQFYPSDWNSDPKLCACSYEAQGALIRLMGAMHMCRPYGHLAVNGRPMNLEEIAPNLPGLKPKKVLQLLAELEEKGVISRTKEGVIFSRRMVRDEEVRNKRARGGHQGGMHGNKGAAYGVQGGRPRKPETPLRADARGVPKPPPSSSSSSSISPPTPSRVVPVAPSVPVATSVADLLTPLQARTQRQQGEPVG